MNQNYSNEEAEEILRVAVQQQVSGTGAMSRESLLSTAAELGISPDAIQAAETQLAQQRTEFARYQDEKVARAEYVKIARQRVRSRLSGWLTMSLTMFGINAFTSWGSWWCQWIIFFGGIGLIGPAVNSLLHSPDQDEEGFREWLAERDLIFQRWNQFETKQPEEAGRIRAMLARGDSLGAGTILEQKLALEPDERRMLVERLGSP